jgi:hypothetical protein
MKIVTNTITLTPTWLAGKGFGFLPDNLRLLRPLAVTTELGYSFPTQSSTSEFEAGVRTQTNNPQFLIWGGSVQYSMPYLKARVKDFGLPQFVNRFLSQRSALRPKRAISMGMSARPAQLIRGCSTSPTSTNWAWRQSSP